MNQVCGERDASSALAILGLEAAAGEVEVDVVERRARDRDRRDADAFCVERRQDPGQRPAAVLDARDERPRLEQRLLARADALEDPLRLLDPAVLELELDRVALRGRASAPRACPRATTLPRLTIATRCARSSASSR